MDELTLAVQAFGHGFARQRSVRKPFEFVGAGPLWVLRDPPGTKRPRVSEIIVHDLDSPEARLALAKYAPPRHLLSVTCRTAEDDEKVRDYWKEAGYRLLRREPFFLARPEPHASGPFDVRPVRTWADAEEIAAAAGKAQVRRADLEDGSIRLYGAWVEDRPVGWVRSIDVPGAAWVANLRVLEAFRRQGIGGALMRALLNGDAEHGIPASVLLSSEAGSHLYPRVGYRQVGMLLIFAKRKRAGV